MRRPLLPFPETSPCPSVPLISTHNLEGFVEEYYAERVIRMEQELKELKKLAFGRQAARG